jgi:hypothetical protein
MAATTAVTMYSVPTNARQDAKAIRCAEAEGMVAQAWEIASQRPDGLAALRP